MPVLHRLRLYHAILVALVVSAYATGELEPLHSWLGYAVGLVIVGRLLWAATGVPQLGLMRFYPLFDGLRLGTALTHPAISRALLLGIAVCLIGVTATGIAMDRGRMIGIAAMPGVARVVEGQKGFSVLSAKADSHREDAGDDEREGTLSEAHELLANLLMIVVGMHVSYLLLFKRQLARFMLFIDGGKK